MFPAAPGVACKVAARARRHFGRDRASVSVSTTGMPRSRCRQPLRTALREPGLPPLPVVVFAAIAAASGMLQPLETGMQPVGPDARGGTAEGM
ncbi:hypothetical protein LNKW23_05860 [Paralimibaculum aggregatum]|uniref:Uncharacterized protein n=1 Tax=Paralimibaculum aggregatum TaxID=3036245 RepID=A0ABQ6LJI2_9RHOB|nr:hypothetical protein LNKW23_05860 [Limibaculum sp. NKW23]